MDILDGSSKFIQSSFGIHKGFVPGSLRIPKSVVAQVPYIKCSICIKPVHTLPYALNHF